MEGDCGERREVDWRETTNKLGREHRCGVRAVPRREGEGTCQVGRGPEEEGGPKRGRGTPSRGTGTPKERSGVVWICGLTRIHKVVQTNRLHRNGRGPTEGQ